MTTDDINDWLLQDDVKLGRNMRAAPRRSASARTSETSDPLRGHHTGRQQVKLPAYYDCFVTHCNFSFST